MSSRRSQPPSSEGRPAAVQAGPDVLLAVQVQPRASRNQLVALLPDRLTLRLTAPPVEGAANAACCAFLADLLDLPKSRISVLRGDTARHKLLRIRDIDAASVIARLQSSKQDLEHMNPQSTQIAQISRNQSFRKKSG